MEKVKSIPEAWSRNCPFCDNYIDTEAIHFEYKKDMVAVKCSKCGICGPFKPLDTKHETPEIAAIQWWNQRKPLMTKKDANEIIKELKHNGWEKGEHNDYFLDDCGNAEVVESEFQHIWLRVGGVFHGNKPSKEPGIWIETQPVYMRSSIEHTMLFSKSTWDKLNKFVQKHFKLIQKREKNKNKK